MGHILWAVFENTYFSFFSDFKKHDLRFFEITFQKKDKKSPKVSSLLNVYRNFGLKTPGPDVMGIYRHL